MEELIISFTVENAVAFFRKNIKSFKPLREDFSYILNSKEFSQFSDVLKIGEATFKTYEDLLVFAAKVKGDLSERSSKRAQFEVAKKVLKQDFKDGSIFIFYDDQGNFRFSFIRRNYGDKSNKFTSWKRFTYYVVKEQTNKTFKDRIGNCSFDSLDAIQDAFSVEKLNKEFYQKIAKAFYSLIGGKIKINTKEEEFKLSFKMPGVPASDKKTYQEFAVRLVGRTIFCWFLKNKKSENGFALLPDGWLSSKVVAEVNNNQHNYYHAILEKLFFEVLNQKIPDRIKSLPDGHEKIPYLNGGLFEPIHEDFYELDKSASYSKHLNTLVIHNKWFVDFFEVLEQYNFTIDENSIHDNEVSIDPEMLGTIFENLLAEIDPDTEKSARKSTGSFYTPREIVDYMVEQSLVQYLKTKTTIDDEEKLLSLFTDDAEHSFSDKEVDNILKAISDVKILDPACGSGAFPMGALHKIVKLLQKLDKGAVWWKKKQLEKAKHLDSKYFNQFKEKLESSNSDYARKLGVIQHSIYGVDIQPIAAEISKLRSFLSLIIDENIDDKAPNRGIEPLPNLEFKFVTANTLIGLDESISKNIGSVSTGTLDFGETENLQDDLQQIRNAYLGANPTEKEELREKFEKLQTKIFKLETKGSTPSKRAIQLAGWKPFSNESSGWFDSDWMFGVDKFDIVIGNPPYVNIKNQSPTTRKLLKTDFRYSQGADIYVAFLEISMEKFLKNNGNLTFIIPNKFFGASYGEAIRQYLQEQVTINVIFDLKDEKVFESAQISTIVFCANKTVSKGVRTKIKNRTEIITVENIFDVNGKIQIEQNDSSSSIINKLYNYKKLSDFGTVRTGCMGFEYWRMKDIITNNFEKPNSIRIFTNGNLKKYRDNWASEEISLYKNKYLKPRIILDESYLSKNTIEFFKAKNKVIIRGVAKEMSSILDETGGAMLVAVHGFLPDKYSPKPFVLILNSKLINWFHLQTYYSQRIPQGSLKYPINFIESVPIVDNSDAFKWLELKYDELIISIDSEEEYSKIQKEIDEYIFDLYSLTKEEVLLINQNDGQKLYN